MRHTKPLTRRPAQAQSAYASKLLFKQEASTLITEGTVGVFDAVMTLGSAIFVNSLGLNFFIDLIIDDGNDTTS